MASTRVTKVYGSSGNRRTYTLSAWVKRSGLGSHQDVISAFRSTDGLQTDVMRFQNDDKFQFYMHTTSGGTNAQLTTIRKFRDTNAWYHIVTRVDTTQGTAADRVRIYINGVLQDAFSTETYPDQNEQSIWGLGDSNVTHTIGAVGSSNYLDGYLSHVHYADGQSLAPTVFGETDSTTGEWRIITNPSFTLGTNGFTILKDGNTVTDQSSNSNDFSVASGTLTKSEDNPSNVFCVLNVLNGARPTGGIEGVLKYGNTEYRDGENGSNYSYVAGTMGANSGKFYWETKVTDLAEIDQVGVALASSSFVGAANTHGLQATNYGGKGCQFSNGYKVGDGSGGAYMGGFSVNDIMMVALDLDNNKITFGRNGQWSNGSGGADQTYANSTAAYTNLTAGEYYVPAQAKRASGANYGTNNYNFGNGYFGLTAVASAGTNASNNGIFEYDVPTGFTALSTKGLNL